MFINPPFMDAFRTRILKKEHFAPLVGGIFLLSVFNDNKRVNYDWMINDWMIKKRGRCDKELTAFGKCLEEHRDRYEPCKEFLDAYKRCLQK